MVKEFPKYKYHATETPVIVENAEQESALGSGWSDTVVAESVKTAKEPTAADKTLAEVDLATAQRTVKTHAAPLAKSSGIAGDAGAWTDAGDGKDYPSQVKTGADAVKGADAKKGAK